MTTEDLQQALEGATLEITDLKRQISVLQFKVYQGEANQRVVNAMEMQRKAFHKLVQKTEERMEEYGDKLIPISTFITGLKEQLIYTEACIEEQIKCKS